MLRSKLVMEEDWYLALGSLGNKRGSHEMAYKTKSKIPVNAKATLKAVTCKYNM